MATKRAVILLSGGLDSATTLYYAKKQNYQLSALIFDYKQRHKKEIRCAKKIAVLNDIPYFMIKTNLSWAQSSLTCPRIKVPLGQKLNRKEIPATYVSGRNIIFLSYAFSLAESIGAQKIFIGAHVQDYSGYPDCRPEFIRAFESAANRGIKDKGIKIVAPLLHKTKKEIVKLGNVLGVPFQYTWSCYQGGKNPCLQCDSCRFRINAFRELGMKDPLEVSSEIVRHTFL